MIQRISLVIITIFAPLKYPSVYYGVNVLGHGVQVKDLKLLTEGLSSDHAPPHLHKYNAEKEI